LRLMVSPDLNTIVEGDDQNWLDPLLVDLQDRAGMQPADLFKQLSSLGVGPLVAQEVGEEIGKYPRLRDLQKQFIDLDIKPRRKTD